jgi:tRNA isopentenyl-2-thiomethyl-A-37 hydroxylase MiaE
MKCEMPEVTVAEGITPFLEEIFENEQNFWKMADGLQNLKGKYSSDTELIEKIVQLLRQDARYFLVLAHLHRQLRFTNLELMHFFFNREKLDDLQYYSDLLKDEAFKERFEKTTSSKKWNSYVGTLDPKNSGKDNEDILLASLKKAMDAYLNSEKTCWPMWSARIRNDPSVAQRISEFVEKKEDLKKLVETDTVRSSLLRSLRTVNVEILKRERGEYASRKVKEILEKAGFVFEPYPKAKDVKDLESTIKTSQPVGKTSSFIYTCEKLWKEQDKRFDFALVSKNHIQFVVEVNYFTTSMSKIREVVRHFMELKKACREKYRLIYITDGMGWFGLAKDVKKMLEFETDELKIEPSKIPFLMNLKTFEQNIDAIKAEM